MFSVDSGYAIMDDFILVGRYLDDAIGSKYYWFQQRLFNI